MKFRIWNNNLRAFVSPSEYFVNSNGDVYYFDVMDGELVKCDKCIVQYWSGHLDIHGKEIYEGDIVKYVVWGDEHNPREYKREGCVTRENMKFYPVTHTNNCFVSCYSWGLKDFEVIGDIFENSDLLK